MVPNLYKIARAYVKNDKRFFREAIKEDHSIRKDLGLGGMFMNFIVSPGQDTMLINRDVNQFIAGYAHLYSYDFRMMKILLSKCGFSNIKEKKNFVIVTSKTLKFLVTYLGKNQFIKI